jgi:hypothetical protein
MPREDTDFLFFRQDPETWMHKSSSMTGIHEP